MVAGAIDRGNRGGRGCRRASGSRKTTRAPSKERKLAAEEAESATFGIVSASRKCENLLRKQVRGRRPSGLIAGSGGRHYYENSGEYIGHYVAWLNARAKERSATFGRPLHPP
jgi:hypothetical protein